MTLWRCFTPIAAVLLLVLPAQTVAHVDDDPTLTMVKFDQLEWRDADDGGVTALKGHLWIGKDLHKAWFNVEGKWHDGETEAAEVQALYSRAVAPYWDLQLGWRRDLEPEPSRDWLAIGFKGLAPYHVEMTSALFLGDDQRSALRIKAEYELMLTQRWVLVPEVELNLHGKDDPATHTGSGLSEVHAGVRLGYEIVREFAPYVGWQWNGHYGRSAEFAREDGESPYEQLWVIGVRAWF